MRPLELLVLLANALVSGALVVDARRARTLSLRNAERRPRWLRAMAAVTIVAASLQCGVEGARWQMFAAYAWACLVNAIAWRRARKVSVHPRSPARRAARIALTVMSTLACVTTCALPVALPVFHFPAPGGPHAIGTLTYHWVDGDRAEVFTEDPSDRRELMVQVWYPAEPSPRAEPRARYIDDATVLAPLARLLHLPPFIFDQLSLVMTDAVAGAGVAQHDARYPVLIFSHGRGGFRGHDTLLVQELVSHGYVVAAMDHPFAASGVVFPDGRLVPFDPRMAVNAFVDGKIDYLAQDALFTLRQLGRLNVDDPHHVLQGHLDLERAGIFGVSLGGEVSFEACRLELQLRACLAMDVWMPPDVADGGLLQPMMLLSRDAASMHAEGWSDVDVDRTQTTMRAAFEHSQGARYLVRVPGMFHADFSDAALLSPLTSLLGITGPIAPARAHALVAAYVVSFFDKHLRGRSAPLLNRPPGAADDGVLFESGP